MPRRFRIPVMDTVATEEVTAVDMAVMEADMAVTVAAVTVDVAAVVLAPGANPAGSSFTL